MVNFDMRLTTRILVALALLGAISTVAYSSMHKSAQHRSTQVAEISIVLPAYIPAGAYVWQETSPSQKGANGVGNVLYRLPGQPAKDSPTYPFRIISVSEGRSSLYNNTFPTMSFTTGARESVKTDFTLDGGPARLYTSADSNGWDQLEWIANGTEASIGTCSSCGVSISQLFKIARSLPG